MINGIKEIFKKNKVWISTICALNIFFGILLWLIDSTKLSLLFPICILGSFIIYFFVGICLYKSDLKRKDAINSLLEDSSLLNERKINQLFTKDERIIVSKIGARLREDKESIIIEKKNMAEYKEYIEGWAHEIKTPLGLMTFILDNRKDEMNPIVYKRLEYARTKMQDDVERMLYYARLKASKGDYFFTELSIKEITKEVIDEYDILLKEQGIEVIEKIDEANIVSDKKALQFIIRQIISNSIKYKSANREESKIIIESINGQEKISLNIRDNGIGVKAFDLPFIFEKGFTGEIGEQRKNSTGMGLYLAEEIAKDLKIQLKVNERYSDGFEISIIFPRVG